MDINGTSQIYSNHQASADIRAPDCQHDKQTLNKQLRTVARGCTTVPGKLSVLVHCRDGKFRSLLDAGRPARSHRLGTGIEAYRIRPVLVQITER